MTKTLLAVDDSVTMRKVLEITFSGNDYRVLTAENAQSALVKAGEADVFVIDTVLGAEDGYAVAKAVRSANPNAPILLLSSRYAPYDQAKGRDAGADDFADKPFDTTQLLDKLKKVVLAREAGGAPARPIAPVAIPPSAPMRPQAPPPPPPTPVATAPAFPRGTQPSLGDAAARANQSSANPPLAPQAPQAPFVPPPPPPSAPVAPPPPMAAQARPPGPDPVSRVIPPQAAAQAAAAAAFSAPPAPAPPRPATAEPAVSASINGHMAANLKDLGLTPEQAQAVMALSRDVVEKVVWEVVPRLAETLIKEEIARLMK